MSASATTLTVPLAAKRAAGRALLIHQRHPDVDGVQGVALARRLTTGQITPRDIATMHQFFQRQDRAYRSALSQLRTEQDSAIVRSWSLHGAESGKAFAQAHHKALVKTGDLDADPVDGLFDLVPEQIYARFQAGAWRWEYDLNPRKAAAFVQHYTDATGQQLDLPKAFGDSALAVGNQVWRRYHGPNLFQQARKALKIDDWSLKRAAQADLRAFQHDFPLTESLNWKKLERATPKQAADVWPVLVAYLILAIESPARLATVHAASAKVPRLDERPKSFLRYHDALNTWVMHFHPLGKRFVHPVAEFVPMTAELYDLMLKAARGKRLRTNPVQRTLWVARAWLHKNRRKGQTLANSFSILLAHWKRKDWQAILDVLPQDADIRPAFAEFVAAKG